MSLDVVAEARGRELKMLQSNAEIFDFDLDEKDMAQLDNLDEHLGLFSASNNTEPL